MDEHQSTTVFEENKPQAPPAEAITPGSMDSGATEEKPAVKTDWDNTSDVVLALKSIKALADSLNSIHAAIPIGVEPFHDTVPIIGDLIVEKAEEVAEVLGLSLKD